MRLSSHQLFCYLKLPLCAGGVRCNSIYDAARRAASGIPHKNYRVTLNHSAPFCMSLSSFSSSLVSLAIVVAIKWLFSPWDFVARDKKCKMFVCLSLEELFLPFFRFPPPLTADVGCLGKPWHWCVTVGPSLMFVVFIFLISALYDFLAFLTLGLAFRRSTDKNLRGRAFVLTFFSFNFYSLSRKRSWHWKQKHFFCSNFIGEREEKSSG